MKHQLPHPYDQDLSGILRRLDRRTPSSRGRLANDPVTAAYLAAGMRLIERHLGPGCDPVYGDPEDGNSLQRPLLGFLSQRAVAAEVSRNPDPFPQVGSVSTLRSTWRSQSDFVADLLRFGLWSSYQPSHCDTTEHLDVIQDFLDGPDMVRAVHTLSYANLLTLIERPKFRFELVAIAASDGDDVVRQAMAENYRGTLQPWKEICQEVLRMRKLRLRAGITIDDLVNLLTAVTEGVGLRGLADPTSGVIDHARQRTLLGTGILALILGCTERCDSTEAVTIDQAVHEMVHGGPRSAGCSAADPAAP